MNHYKLKNAKFSPICKNDIHDLKCEIYSSGTDVDDYQFQHWYYEENYYLLKKRTLKSKLLKAMLPSPDQEEQDTLASLFKEALYETVKNAKVK